MVLVALMVVVLTGNAVGLVPAIACVLMMAVMMRMMAGGHQQH